MNHPQNEHIEPGMLETHIVIIEDEMYLLLNLSGIDSGPITMIMNYEQAQSLVGVVTDYLVEADEYYEN